MELPFDLVNGFRVYTNNSYRLACSAENLGLRIGLYSSLNMESTAHYALFVGQGHTIKWRIFKIYYDIIATWNQNFTIDSCGNIVLPNNPSQNNYYVVNHAYSMWYYRRSLEDDYE